MTRDTDADWTVISEGQPYFGVLSEPRFLSENLTAETVDDFYATGVADVAAIAAKLQQLGGAEFAPHVALDFGCGVGRLTLAMAPYATKVVGVDVAEPMLVIARKRAEERAIGNVVFDRAVFPAEVDWINSLIVMQHIPPRRGIELLDEMLAKLRPGGFASIQLTFYHDSRHKGEVDRVLADYRFDGETIDLLSPDEATPAGVMTMYDYDLNRVFMTFFKHGLEELVVQHTDHAGCHGVFVFGRRHGDRGPT